MVRGSGFMVFGCVLGGRGLFVVLYFCWSSTGNTITCRLRRPCTEPGLAVVWRV